LLLLPTLRIAFIFGLVVETVPETVTLFVPPVVLIPAVVVTVMEPVEVTLILSLPSSVLPPFSVVTAESMVKSSALAALVKANRETRIKAARDWFNLKDEGILFYPLNLKC